MQYYLLKILHLVLERAVFKRKRDKGKKVIFKSCLINEICLTDDNYRYKREREIGKALKEALPVKSFPIVFTEQKQRNAHQAGTNVRS